MASKRNNITFSQPAVPSFLKKFKERVGYKEPTNINDKFSDSLENSESENTGENDEKQVDEEQPVIVTGENDEKQVDEEQPVIVVLKEGDMTAQEVEKYEKENSSADCWDADSDKPVFKKPIKRSSTEKQAKDEKKKRKTDVKVKPVKNSKLLSFDDEDDEES